MDTSAILAIAAGEQPLGPQCAELLLVQTEILISAGTVLEALIVAQSRGLVDEVRRFLEQPNLTVVDVTAASAHRAAGAYAQWGKGVHRAALNYGDCFAYELAMSRACPLLFVGNDFARTDVRSAL